MKRISAFILALAMPLTSFAAEPSAMFGQELAQVAKPNAINIDFYGLPGPNGIPQTIRLGTNKGEVIAVFNANGAVAGQSLSYKWFVNKSFAVYGGLGINGGTTTDLIIGGAYTINSNNIRFNINPVINLTSPSQTDIYGGAYMKVNSNDRRNRMLVGAQFHMDVTANTSDVIGGIRWMPRDNLTVDLALVNTAGGGSLDFPGVFAINMSF